MQDLPREYTLLFNAITDADRLLLQLHERLVLAQQAAEELFTSQEPNENADSQTNTRR